MFRMAGPPTSSLLRLCCLFGTGIASPVLSQNGVCVVGSPHGLRPCWSAGWCPPKTFLWCCSQSLSHQRYVRLRGTLGGVTSEAPLGVGWGAGWLHQN